MRYGYPADSPESMFSAYVILDARTGQVCQGPDRSGGRRAGSPQGLAAFFSQPPNRLPGRWTQFKDVWHEAWRR